MRTSRPAHGNRPTARLVTAMLVALILAVLTAAPAMASAASVAAELAKNPVFVDPNAPIQADANALLEKVKAAGTPIYIAVLPDDARDETNGNTDELGGEDRRRAERAGHLSGDRGHQVHRRPAAR